MRDSYMKLRLFCPVISMLLAVLSTSLSASTVVYWTFEDGVPGELMNGTWTTNQVGSYDQSDNHYDFYAWTQANSPSFSAEGATATGEGMATVFSGSQDGYNGNSDFVNWSPSAWTIELSFRFDIVGVNKTLIGKDGSAGLSSNRALAAFYLQTGSASEIKLQYVSVSGERFILSTEFVPVAGKWYDLAVRSDGRYLDILINELEGAGLETIGSWDLDTVANSLGDVDHNIKVTSTWTFGRGWYGNSNVDHITGALDDIRFSDERLADGQLLSYRPLVISQTEGKTILFKNIPEESDSFSVVLDRQPSADVEVVLNIPVGLDAGNGNGQAVTRTITPANWNVPFVVELAIADADQLVNVMEKITYSVSSADVAFNDITATALRVYIYADSCGVWGYQPADYNLDCKIDIMDFSILAAMWMAAETPFALDDLAGQWLENTFSYDQQQYASSVKESDKPFYVQADTVANTIDPFVYGHFYEHIYHSANGGLWGELVWNRSFEMNNGGAGGGVWSIENGNELVQSSGSTNVILNFGELSWSDYEISLQASKDGGAEGFLIEFLSDDSQYYWLNLGGWGNTYSAIERAANGSRATVATADFTVNTGQWYNIRIRCEGGNIQVWIDDTQYFNYTDSSPHTDGYCGVGTWSTQARYRNISVVSISNAAVLYSGLPELPYSQNVCDNWQSFGTGSVSRTNLDARNDDYSISIETQSGDCGLIQGDYKFISQNYSGSVWLKGAAAAGVSVELLDETRNIIGSAVLGSPTAQWAEYSFNIMPSVATDSGYLQVRLNGQGEVLVDQVSMMGQDAIDTGGYRPDLLEAVDGLRAPVIRWPGGCFASAYYWKDGIGTQIERNKYGVYLWEDQDVNSYGTDEFLRMCEKLDIEPIIVVNTGILNNTCGQAINNKYSDPNMYLQDAMDWMEYCNGSVATTWGAVRAANGHPEPYNVYYWEIDNETWQAGASAYALVAVEFAIAMRAKAQELGFADQLQLIACGGGDMNASSSGWNGVVISAVDEYVDYISVHRYEDPAAFKNGPLNYENFLKSLHSLILASDNPEMEVYMSEWNAQSIDMRTGLHAGALLNVFERQGEYFTLGGPALFLRHVDASDWNNAFINFDHTGYFLAPNYIVMKLWWDHYAPNRLEISGEDADLNVVATKTDDGDTIYLKIVNPDEQVKSLAFEFDSSFIPAKGYLEYVAPGSIYAANSLSEPDRVKVEAMVIGCDGQYIRFNMPAYSAGVVTVKRSSAISSD